MPNKMKEAVAWFKGQFGDAIRDGVKGTPFTVDMLTAVALQETYPIWGRLRSTLPIAELLEICVGDTLDAPNRSAFPKTKVDLIKASKGTEMFDIARAALVAISKHDATLAKIVAKNPNKFCHGYGLFQYDIQFFPTDPEYFLQKKWRNFPDTLGKCVKELTAAQKRAHLAGKSPLSDMEMAQVAIAYNRGSFDPAKGLKQGHFDGTKFYGEYFAEYLQLAKSVAPAIPATPAAPPAAVAVAVPAAPAAPAAPA